MNPKRAISKLASMIGWARMFPSNGILSLVAILALALTFAVSSPCLAQTTLNLGAAGGYSIFEVNPGGNNSNSQTINVTASSVNGSVALGAYTGYTANSVSIAGSVYEGSNVSGSSLGLTVGGLTHTNVTALGTAGTPAASQAATTAAGETSNATIVEKGSNVSISGNASVVGYTFSSNPNLSGSTITISGNSSQQFILNFQNGLTLANTTIVLTGGVNSNNIFFNVTGGNVSITESTVQGTFLDMVSRGGTEPTMTFSNDSLQGSIVTDTNLTISDTSIVAPELPTIMMAGIACLFLLGKAGLDCGRRLAARTASPQPSV